MRIGLPFFDLLQIFFVACPSLAIICHKTHYRVLHLRGLFHWILRGPRYYDTVFPDKALSFRVMLAQSMDIPQDASVEGHPVFCMKCGKELPDDAQFCLKCGTTLSPTPATPANPPPIQKRSSPAGRIIGWALLVAFLAFAAWRIYVLLDTAPHAPGTPTAIQSILEQNVPITNSTIVVKPVQLTSFTIVVPENAVHVSVDGHFSTTGGLGNDIEVYLLTVDGFANLRNGHPSQPLYSSGKTTQGSINATLPSGAGTYYLVFDNGFSIFSAKTVQANAMLHYMN